MQNEYSDHCNKNSSNLAFALAHEVQQYVAANAETIDSNVWDNIQYWRSGILSQGAITEENLAEIISYLGVEKLQELIAIASTKN